MKKTFLFFLLIAVTAITKAQTIVGTPTTQNGQPAVQLSITDQANYPGYYADEDGIMPEDGYSYFWYTEHGFVSHQQNPIMVFPAGGSPMITLVLTPRKKPSETSQIVKQNPVAVSQATSQNESMQNEPLYFTTEPKVGEPIYLVIPINSCGKELAQDYDIEISAGLDAVQVVSQNVTNFTAAGNLVSFSKNWLADYNRQDICVVLKFFVNADIGEEVWAKFVPQAGNCQVASQDSGTVTAGPYDPNYKASDIGEINTGLDPNRRIQPTNVRYTIHFQNIGEGPVDSVTVTDLLPQYLTYVGNVTSSHAVTTTRNGQSLQWVMGSMRNESQMLWIRGTNERIMKPIPSTKGWIAFDAQISPTNNMPIVKDTCYCLCNVATVYFDSLAPINTKADIIAIGDSVCFADDVVPPFKKRMVDRICYNSTNFYKETLGISDLIRDKKAGFTVGVYPNPTSSLIRLAMESQLVEKVELYNLNGILLPITVSESLELDLSNVASGIYYLRIWTLDGLFSARVIKE